MIHYSTSASAYDFEIDGIYYNITDSTSLVAEVTGDFLTDDNGGVIMSSYSGNVIIPKQVTYNNNDYSVTTIGSSAFIGCTNLISVTLPNSITKIDYYAFQNCSNMIEIVIPNTILVINTTAFRNCTGLRYVKISDLAAWCKIEFRSGGSSNPLYYGASLLLNGTETTDMIIPYDVTEISKFAFCGYSKLKSVTIPNTVVQIGASAFYECSGLTSVTIPNSVTSIGSYAFWGCSALTSVTIPKSATTLGQSIFSGCSGLTSIVVENGNPVYDSRDNCNAVIETASNKFIRGCENSFIPSSITTIEDYAFLGCSGLNSISISNSVTSIGYNILHGTGWYNSQADGALYIDNCYVGYKGSEPSGILRLKDGTRLICDSGFWGFENITEIVIPKSLTKIGSFGKNFPGVTAITSLNPEPPICVDDYTFYGFNSDNCTLKVPPGSKEAYANDTHWSYFANIEEIATVDISTQDNCATFNIPTTENAVSYVVNIYSDESMAQLVTSANYDATGTIMPMSTSLELSIDGLASGTYYYAVIASSSTGEDVGKYIGSFEIATSNINNISIENHITETSRYDINGRQLEQPTQGINIIKMSDGSTRKEWVK